MGFSDDLRLVLAAAAGDGEDQAQPPRRRPVTDRRPAGERDRPPRHIRFSGGRTEILARAPHRIDMSEVEADLDELHRDQMRAWNRRAAEREAGQVALALGFARIDGRDAETGEQFQVAASALFDPPRRPRIYDALPRAPRTAPPAPAHWRDHLPRSDPRRRGAEKPATAPDVPSPVPVPENASAAVPAAVRAAPAKPPRPPAVK
jgi:hypothetical protein